MIRRMAQCNVLGRPVVPIFVWRRWFSCRCMRTVALWELSWFSLDMSKPPRDFSFGGFFSGVGGGGFVHFRLTALAYHIKRQ